MTAFPLRRSRFAAAMLLCMLAFPAAARAQTAPPYSPQSIPTSDGKTLAADLYAYDTTVAKPVILIQTPYNKDLYRAGLDRGGPSFPNDPTHYNYLILDWRGFYGSTDAQVAGYNRGLDGYDAVEWIALQPWCNGRVGTWGPSALGHIQFLTAREHPPHLVCAVPLVKDYKTKYTDYYYGGDFRKEHVETLARLGFITTDVILQRPMYSPVWKVLETSSDFPEDIAVPMLLISGWFDHYPDDVLRAFADLRARSNAGVRSLHKMIMGPWLHSGVGKAAQGELTYPGAQGVADSAALQFFDRYLREMQNGYEQRPDFSWYQMGTNQWRSAASWSGLERSTDTLYFQSDGSLQHGAPTRQSSSLPVYCNPKNPSPSKGGARFNPFDPTVKEGPLDIHGSVETRPDAVSYTTPVFTEACEIRGPVRVHAYVASNRLDTDFSIRLCDVYPDGRSMIMTDGIQRARFRVSPEWETLLVPDSIVPVDIALQNLALTILPGHALRIVVASSDYPRFDINLNNGGALYAPGDTLTATNRLYHEAAHPSCVTMEIAPKPVAAEPAPAALEHCAILAQYPEPAGAFATFRMLLPAGRGGALEVYDALGRLRATVPLQAAGGETQATIDTRALADGLHVGVLRSGASVAVRPFLVRHAAMAR